MTTLPGSILTFNHLNIFTFITTKEKAATPRITQFELLDFLESLGEGFFDSQPLIVSEPALARNLERLSSELTRYIGNIKMHGEDSWNPMLYSKYSTG